jgi:hypothetical protein
MSTFSLFLLFMVWFIATRGEAEAFNSNARAFDLAEERDMLDAALDRHRRLLHRGEGNGEREYYYDEEGGF